MGNSHGKESRHGSRPGASGSLQEGPGTSASASAPTAEERAERARQLANTILGTSSSSRHHRVRADAPFEHRETRQEREARRLERERAARVKERERSMKEESVDGGFLVTMGVYTASEDFSKTVVRQLQIERKIAPFWRGLDDFEPSWAEHQIIAAARGLEIPPADEVPEHLKMQPRPSDSPNNSSQNINNLTVPMGPRTLSAGSSSQVPSPTTASKPPSSLKPHKKALAAALSLTRNGSQPEIAPREVNLPHEPFVNGQPLEVFLYKDGLECPLCLMYYPPYMNRTRCCDQTICSECFVQIKRPDPHYPEHHGEDGAESPSNQENSGELIMEAAKCPYCTQTEFGVTYEPPPFRRGLVYAMGPPGLGSHSTAMSSTSSLNSNNLTPHSQSPPPQSNRRRAQSLSATASGVITTDRVRPEWTNKLAQARQQQRRRAAAADALHHAAFFQNEQQRTLFGRSSRFSRRATREGRGQDGQNSASGSQQPSDGVDTPGGGPEPGPRISSGRLGLMGRERIDANHLESLMMAEAIRLSLAEAEEQRKKEEKEARKEAKKREKEERKASKQKDKDERSGIGSSPNASSLNLGFGGRKRGNSAASSSLRPEAGLAASSAVLAAAGAPMASQSSSSPPLQTATSSDDKGKSVDRGEDDASPAVGGSASPVSIPSVGSQPQLPRGVSHLRQMSIASTVSSSDGDSMAGSYQPKMEQDPRSSGLSVAQSEGGSNNNEGDNGNGSSSSQEPLFNFRSLAEIVGVPIDEPQSPGSGGEQSPPTKGGDAEEAENEHVEHVSQPTTAAAGATDGLTASVTVSSDRTMTEIPEKKEEEEKSTAATAPTNPTSQQQQQEITVSATETPTSSAETHGDRTKQPVVSTAEAPSQISQ